MDIPRRMGEAQMELGETHHILFEFAHRSFWWVTLSLHPPYGYSNVKPGLPFSNIRVIPNQYPNQNKTVLKPYFSTQLYGIF